MVYSSTCRILNLLSRFILGPGVSLLSFAIQVYPVLHLLLVVVQTSLLTYTSCLFVFDLRVVQALGFLICSFAFQKALLF